MALLSIKLKANADSKIQKILDKSSTRIERVARDAAEYAALSIEKDYPKKTGKASRNFRTIQRGSFSYDIISKLEYPSFVEFGSRPAIIRPKNKKMLLFSIDDKNLDLRTGRIKTSAKNAFFAALKKAKSNDRRSVMNRFGIVLARKVKKPAIPGRHLMKREFAPKIRRFITGSISAIFREMF